MSIPTKKEAKGENTLSFFLSIFFTVLVTAMVSIIYKMHGSVPTSMPVFDFIIIILASFRLTRLIVYDSIAQYIRDLFIDKTQVWDKKEKLFIVKRNKPLKGLRRKFYELLACPWCFGVWITFIVVFFYFLTPIAWIVLLGLAAAGVSTVVQLLANLIGWHAEGKKLSVQKEEKN